MTQSEWCLKGGSRHLWSPNYWSSINWVVSAWSGTQRYCFMGIVSTPYSAEGCVSDWISRPVSLIEWVNSIQCCGPSIASRWLPPSGVRYECSQNMMPVDHGNLTIQHRAHIPTRYLLQTRHGSTENSYHHTGSMYPVLSSLVDHICHILAHHPSPLFP